MRTNAAGMSPAKMAMADTVTMATSAGTGSMKKVKGTRRATAMVAVRPGMAPKIRPRTAATRIVRITVGSARCSIPCSAASISGPPDSDGQRHPQYLFEQHHRGEDEQDGGGDGNLPPYAEDEHEAPGHERSGYQEANRFNHRDIERDSHKHERCPDDGAACVGLAFSMGPHGLKDDNRPGDGKHHSQDLGEERWPRRAIRHLREGLRLREGREAQYDPGAA